MKSNSWKTYTELNQRELPAAIRCGLLDRGSLTARLITASDGNFQVQVLEQTWRTPYLNEATLLGMQPRQKALIREVLLLCHGEPWVYARSVIPFSSLKGRLGFLRKLKNSALGALLFKDPNLQRSHFQINQISLPQAPIPTEEHTTVYGRRSLFHLYGKPLLVAEVFLPACKL
ncbi:MAG: chorismate lyase [Pseudomonadales bacterium]|nr:chorismate lyase [Pseudomonadales bacterium]